MALFSLLGAVGAIAGGALGADASRKAANAQADANRYAADVQRQNFLDTQEMYRPAVEAGDTARDYQLGLLNIGGVGNQAALDAFQTSPGYQFAFDQGTRAVDSSAASRGMLNSGATLKALTEYGQGMANQEFGNYYNRLAGLSGAGQTATGAVAGVGTNTANNISSLAQNTGNARASSYINSANAMTGGLQGIYNAYANQYRPQNNNVPWRNPDTGVIYN